MGEQLAMPLAIGPGEAGADAGPSNRSDASAPARPGRDPAAERTSDRSRHRRGWAGGNRPVRGEPDLPETRPSRSDWRIDPRTRARGLRGVARARAALEATAGPGPEHGHVDAA